MKTELVPAQMAGDEILEVVPLEGHTGESPSGRPKQRGQRHAHDRLVDHPYVLTEIRNDIRELIVSPYRIIYRRDEDVVYITMVLPAWAPWLEGSQTAIARRTSSAPTPW